MTRLSVGRRAELAVADYLIAEGFAILARNVRIGPLELDVVARKGPLVIVVEVRTRGTGSYQHAFESISLAKRERVMKAVRRFWSQELAAMEGVERVRVDAAAVTFEGQKTTVEYVEGGISG